jgi:hypothetical protein
VTATVTGTAGATGADVAGAPPVDVVVDGAVVVVVVDWGAAATAVVAGANVGARPDAARSFGASSPQAARMSRAAASTAMLLTGR